MTTRPKECGEATWIERRREEKAASRAEDALKTVEELRRENGAFAFPRHMIRINWSKTKKHY